MRRVISTASALIAGILLLTVTFPAYAGISEADQYNQYTEWLDLNEYLKQQYEKSQTAPPEKIISSDAPEMASNRKTVGKTLLNGPVQYKDGPALLARLDDINTTAVDAYGNVWFVDASGKNIRRFDNNAKKLETYFIMNSNLDAACTINSRSIPFSYENAKFTNLFSDDAGNIYAGIRYTNEDEYYEFMAIDRVFPDFERITFSSQRFSSSPWFGYDQWALFDGAGNLWFTKQYGTADSTFLDVSAKNTESQNLGESRYIDVGFTWKTAGRSDALMKNGQIYMMTAYWQAMSRMDMATGECQALRSVYRSDASAVAAGKDGFYYILGTKLCYVDLNGKVKVVVNLANVFPGFGIAADMSFNKDKTKLYITDVAYTGKMKYKTYALRELSI